MQSNVLRVAYTTLTLSVAGSFWTAPSLAITLKPPKQEVCDTTDIAVVGKVVSIASTHSTTLPGIVSDVTFDVERVVKGAAGPTLTVFTLGGSVGTERHSVGGFPDFQVGERYFLLLHERSSGHPTIKLGGMGAVLLDSSANLAPQQVLVAHWEDHCNG